MGCRLDKRVQFYTKKVGRTGMGAPAAGFDQGRELSCSFEALSDAEKAKEGRLVSKEVAHFTFRHSAYLAGVSQSARLKFRGEFWEVVAKKVIGRRAWVRVTAVLEV